MLSLIVKAFYIPAHSQLISSGRNVVEYNLNNAQEKIHFLIRKQKVFSPKMQTPSIFETAQNNFLQLTKNLHIMIYIVFN